MNAPPGQITGQGPAIAVVHDYAELIAALRARSTQLGITRQTLDHITGLRDGYSGTLLAPNPIKSLGKVSMGLILQGLGVMLIVVEDPEALSRIRKQLTPRARPANTDDVGIATENDEKALWERQKLWSDWGRLMSAKRVSKLPAWKRSQIARRNVRKRWRKRRRATAHAS